MKSLSILKLSAGALLAAMTIAGCRCGPPPITGTKAEFAVEPAALSFSACPTKDESGLAVADVYPDEQLFKLLNLGKVAGTVSRLEFTGDGASRFSIADDKKPTVVEGAGEVEVPVRFSPDKKGDVQATLTIDDESEDTQPVTVNLIGTGVNLPSQPTVQLAYEKSPGTFQDCDPSVLSGCSPKAPRTFFNETTSITFKVKNGGCPTLKIKGIQIRSHSGQTAAQQAFSFESGFLSPTEQNPASLSSADDNNELVFKLQFNPVDETTNPSFPDDGQRYAILELTTTDPLYPTLEIALEGLGEKPSAYLTPTFCNFTDSTDNCGFATRTPGKARIQIGNNGSAPITVKALTFTNGGRNGRFALSGTSTLNQSIPVGATNVFQEVSYTDQPLFVSDDLIVATVDSADPTKPAGDVKVTFYGGTLPCLSTEPGDQLSFDNPAAELTVKDVVIKNGAGCGTLIIDDVVVDQPNAFFSVIDPKLAPGTPVTAGSSVTAKVQFKKPVSGGSQSGVLRVKTNDPAFGPEPYKVLTLYSQAPVNQLPIAVLKGPAGQETSMTISKQSLASTQHKIQLSGADSYDPPAGPGSVPTYQFSLVLKPSNATAASLPDTGKKVTSNTVLLQIDPNVTGEYRVALKVYDAEGQPSANLAALKIFITP